RLPETGVGDARRVRRLGPLSVGLIAGRLVQTARGERRVGDRQLDGGPTARRDPALDLAQETAPEPLAAQLRRYPHREDVKRIAVLLVPERGNDPHGLGGP